MMVDKLKQWIGIEPIDQEDDFLGDNIDTSNDAQVSSQVILFEPRDYTESHGIASHLLSGKGCIINLHLISKEEAQRLIDFIYGIVFAIEGSIQSIGNNVFLVTSNNFGVLNDSQ